MELETAGRRVDDVAVALREAARRIDTSHPPVSAWGTDGSGALGELGRAWSAKISGALAARADEAQSLADAADELAGAAGVATGHYRDVESRRGGA
jgi:hypothetical protein